MKRREFIAGIGAAATLPFAARAQTAAMPLIGFLHAGSPEENAKRPDAFRKGLAAAGFVEGKKSPSNIGGHQARIRSWRRWPPI